MKHGLSLRILEVLADTAIPAYCSIKVISLTNDFSQARI